MKRKRGLDFAKSGPLFERATFGVCSGDTLQNKVNAGDLWVRCTSGGADSRLQLKNKTKEEKMIKAIIFLETILTNFVKIDMMAITSKRKEDAEHDHHQRDGLRAAHFAGAAGWGEALRGRNVGNGIDPQSVCLPDSAQALRRQFGAGEPRRSRRLRAVLRPGRDLPLRSHGGHGGTGRSVRLHGAGI